MASTWGGPLARPRGGGLEGPNSDRDETRPCLTLLGGATPCDGAVRQLGERPWSERVPVGRAAPMWQAQERSDIVSPEEAERKAHQPEWGTRHIIPALIAR